MFGQPWFRFGFFLPLLAALLLVVAVSCGGGATSTAAPQPEAMEPTTVPATEEAEEEDEEPQVHLSPTATPAPAPGATATAVPEVVDTGPEPHGIINTSFSRLGAYSAHTRLKPGESANWLVGISSHEGLFHMDVNSQIQGQMVKDWSIAPDDRTWTFNLNKGINFHQGWGEVTPEDIIFSIRELGAEDGHCGCVQTQAIFDNPDGYFIGLDNYTLELDTGQPAWDVLHWLHMPFCCGAWVWSKKQWDQLLETQTEDEAIGQLVGTGPWELMETQTGEFWKFKAVPDHYRKTPEFAEMKFADIPEESTSLANFQVGKLDVWEAAPDSVLTLAEDPETKFMALRGVSELILMIWGNFYHYVGTDQQRVGYKPDLPYISSNADLDSPEWEQARKVREAISLSIDREKLVEEILGGEGEVGSMYGWQAHKSRWLPGWEWEYDLERARQLMKEAGYEDGFEVTISPAVSNRPDVVQACEAVADMLADININANIKRVPLSVLYPEYKDRSLEGFTCQGSTAFPEPINVHRYSFDPTGAWGVAWDHPWYTERLLKGFGTFDAAERWQAQLEMGQWVRDNAMGLALYGANNLFPLSSKLDPWEEHLSAGSSWISGLEYAPHRQ